MEMYLFILLTLLLSAGIGWVAIPNIVFISKKKRLFDGHDNRKVHKGSISRLGGVSFLPGIIYSFCTVLGIRYLLGYELAFSIENLFFIEFLFFSSGLILLFFIGLADDLIGVGYKIKFIVQLLASLMLVSSGIYLDNLGGLFGLYEIHPALGIIITVMASVLIINSFNLIDGVDGLCSGLGTIALGTLSCWFLFNGFFVYTMVGVSLIGVLFVFFTYNVNSKRLKVFMGDCGSLILGYMVVFMGFKFISLAQDESLATVSPLVMALSMVFVPIFDTFRVFTERILKGKSPFYPDKTHIHHLFLKMGFSHLQSTGIIMMISMFFIVLNFSFSGLNINILFIIDLILGAFLLNILPKYIIKNQKNIK